MIDSFVGICFLVLMFSLVLIGFYCSHKLDSKNPLWVRIIVLMPSLTAMGTIAAIVNGDYVAYWPDVFRAISVILIYCLFASRFTSRPWLDIRRQEKAG